MERRDIVVIGASAGGLDAIGALLVPVEAEFPAAFFLVTHLGRTRAATAYRERAAEVSSHADVLREILVKLPDPG